MSERHYPGEGLLHPIAMMSVVILLLNDHILKHSHPGFITGKLSDVAGLIFFPLLLQAFYELAERFFRGSFTPSVRILWGCSILTAVVFALVKTTALGVVYQRSLYLLQWPFLCLLRGRWLSLSGRVSLVQDATDLIALPGVFFAVWVGARRGRPDKNVVAGARTGEQKAERSS